MVDPYITYSIIVNLCKTILFNLIYKYLNICLCKYLFCSYYKLHFISNIHTCKCLWSVNIILLQSLANYSVHTFIQNANIDSYGDCRTRTLRKRMSAFCFWIDGSSTPFANIPLASHIRSVPQYLKCNQKDLCTRQLSVQHSKASDMRWECRVDNISSGGVRWGDGWLK